MNSYRVLLESEQGIKSVRVTDVDGVKHALLLVRLKYPFSEWRVVNIAEVFAEKPLPVD